MANNKAKEEEKLERCLAGLSISAEKVNSYECSGTHAVIFAGPTRAGKSTIINSLLGIPLERGKKDSGSVHLTKIGFKEQGPKIGNEDVAETYVPENWGKLGSFEFEMWDFPGFGDNRGEVQEITNAAFYEKVLIKQESVRVVLVVPISFSTQEHASRLNNLLDEAKIFCNDPSKSLCLVLTKNNTLDEAIEALECRIKSKGGLSDENKAILNDLLKDGKVVEFKTPREKHVTFEKEKTELEQCVQRLTGTRVSDITLVMGDGAKLFLHKVYEFVLQKHNKDIEQTQEIWNKLFVDKLDEIRKIPVPDCYDRYKEFERDIDGIKQDKSVNPTDMYNNIWRKFGSQRTDGSGSEDHGGLIHLPTLVFLEGLLNKFIENPVDNVSTTTVILRQYVVDKVMELQRIAETIKAPCAEERERMKRSKQEYETLNQHILVVEILKQQIEAQKKQLELIEQLVKERNMLPVCVIQ
jgi:GTP-binding protein EngB required for normal cell division